MLGTARGDITTVGLGTTWIDPTFYDVEIYDTKAYQHVLEAVPSNTADGQPVSLDVSLEISLEAEQVPSLHSNIGRDWYNRVVLPAAREAIRDGASGQDSDTIYTGEGRRAVADYIQETLVAHVSPNGIRVSVNLRAVTFVNQEFVNTLEQKANAAQQQLIQTQLAEAAEQEAIKVENVARGQRAARVQAAEAQREELRLQGEGERLRSEEIAAGNLALALAEAEGRAALNDALSGPGGQLIRDIEVLGGLGGNVDFYGVPTGADGTSTYIIDEALRGQFAVPTGN
jgi:regulator of protease activity HflC (stomatin/prohibitin superfamily)